MVSKSSSHTKKSLSTSSKIRKAAHELLDSIRQSAIEQTNLSRVMLHFSEKRKVVLGKEISKSNNLEITIPVPKTIENRDTARISGKVGAKLGPTVELDFEKKGETIKCFKDKRAKKDE